MIPQPTAHIAKERDALQRFKDFVHRRLDEMGIPTHPDGEHSKAGCRIGDRLDIIQNALASVPQWQYDFIRTANRHISFAQATFHGETSFTALLKLEEEVKELKADLTEGAREAAIKEYADSIFCLISSFGRAGIQAVEVMDAMDKKLEINIKRKWLRNADGTYSHIKEAPTK